MTIADLAKIAGRTYPARRRTQNLVGGMSPIKATNFAVGMVTLEPNGGQVPWHNQEQEEIYFSDPKRKEMFELLSDLYEVARRKALNLPDKLANVAELLDKI